MKIPAAILILLAGLSHALQAGAFNGQCSLSRAHYSLSSDPGTHASFVPYDGGRRVALHVTFPSVDSYWFLIDKGAYAYPRLIATSDVRSEEWSAPDPDGKRDIPDMDIYAWSGDYQFAYDLGHADAPAPRVIMIPGLIEAVRHVGHPPLKIAPGAFKLIDCQ